MSVTMGQKILVGIGEACLSAESGQTLIARNLGSTGGLALHDVDRAVGGVLHWMLPESSLDPHRADRSPCLFFDSGLRFLLQELETAGCRRQSLTVAVAGAASLPDGGTFDVGARNRESLQRWLGKWGLSISSDHTGGDRVRELSLVVGPGKVVVREITL